MEKHPGQSKKHSSKDGGMASRGVTRPMAERDIKEKKGEPSGSGMMDRGDREQMLHMHHMQTLWVYWTIVVLGLWMVTSPLTFDYGKNPVEPSGGREVWLSLADRISAMKWSDIVSGALLIFFGWRSLTPNRPLSMWACCFIGIWISMAPLILWSPSEAAYLNSTLVGALVIALTILVPGMPNMIMYMKMGAEVPQGWTYNPSSWPQRWIMIVAGFLGWIVSRYLAAFQLGYIDRVWDPFFGDSSMQVLNSNMSHSLPVSDAGLGALAYTLEFLMGFMGSPSRWRTMPWMVAFFGILVIPLGLVHIFLVISQPLVVGAWCTFCLVAAGIMLPMIPLEVDEVIAMGQHVKQATSKGEKFWKVFWKGGKPMAHGNDERSPELMTLPQNFSSVFNASIWGMSFPATLVAATVLGIGLMVMPALFGLEIKSSAADLLHLGGALVVVVSVIAMGEVLRIVRYTNIVLALAMAGACWFLDGTAITFNLATTIISVGILLLSLPRGKKTESYGLWDPYVK